MEKGSCQERRCRRTFGVGWGRVGDCFLVSLPEDDQEVNVPERHKSKDYIVELRLYVRE